MSEDKLFDIAIKKHIVDISKDESGKVNVDKAISIARAKGQDSFKDRVRIRRIAEIENNKKK